MASAEERKLGSSSWMVNEERPRVGPSKSTTEVRLRDGQRWKPTPEAEEEEEGGARSVPDASAHPAEWALFCQLDADESGTLNAAELLENVADRDEGVANQLMALLDTNKDGEVDFQEFLAGWDSLFGPVADLAVLVREARPESVADVKAAVRERADAGTLSRRLAAAEEVAAEVAAGVTAGAEEAASPQPELEPEPEAAAEPASPGASPRRTGPRLVIVAGGPGSGKKTQCARLADDLREEYGLVHFSMGELLRSAIESGHEDAAKISKAMIAGDLVPDTIVTKVLLDAIDPSHAPVGRTVILDGFPSNVAQADLLESQIGAPDALIVFHCPEDVMIERVLGRGKKSHRKDDQNMSVLSRISHFNRFCPILVERYEDIIKHVDGSGTVEGAYAELLSEFRSVHAVQWARRDRHLMKSTSMRIKTDKDLLELWNEIDADGSGSLDMQEVQRLSHRLHMPLTHSELRDAMQQMDADGSGEVDFEEFKAWWAKFSTTHGGQVLKSDGAAASPTSAGLDVIEFKVWLSRNGLKDYERSFSAEGYMTFGSLLALGAESVIRTVALLGMHEDEAKPLLEALDQRGGGLGGDHVMAAKDWAQIVEEAELTPEEKAARKKKREAAARRARRLARQKQADMVPHYAQPHLAAMLPEFVNDGAERAAAIWAMPGAKTGTSTTLQDHKWRRHAKAHHAEQKKMRPLSLPALGAATPPDWAERWRGHCSVPPGGHEWRAPGSDHLEHHTAEGSLPCKHSRLVVLANLKRSQLHKLCVEAGVPGREMKTSADMVAALAKRDRQFASVEEKKAARQNNTFRYGARLPGQKELWLDEQPRGDVHDMHSPNSTQSMNRSQEAGKEGSLLPPLGRGGQDQAAPEPRKEKLTRREKRAARAAKRAAKVNELVRDPTTNPMRVVRARRNSGGLYGAGALASSYEVSQDTKAIGDLVCREFESEMMRKKAQVLQKRREGLATIQPWMAEQARKEEAKEHQTLLGAHLHYSQRLFFFFGAALASG